MRRPLALILALFACAFTAQDNKNSAAYLGEGQRLESVGKAAVVTIDQLTVEISKLDAKLQAIDAKRKQYEAESEKSEDSKDRLAPVIRDLDASRAPIDAQKARIDKERTRLRDLRQLERSLEHYLNAVEKAAAEGDKVNLSKALLGVARVNEATLPENVAEAQAAYARIVAECGDQKGAVAEAERKLRLKGVDVYLDQFARFVTEWRDVLRNTSAPLEAKKRELQAKIRAIGRDATPGLIEGFSHRDEMVRAFAADVIAGAADEAGIAVLIQKLSDGSPAVRAGAGLAISRIFETWSTARRMDREADRILAGLDDKDPEDAGSKRLIAANRERANELKQTAAAVRGNLPENLGNKPEIEEALHRLISDESAQTMARMEAAKALRSLGEISGKLVDAVLTGLRSKDRSFREACCVAAAGVDTSNPSKYKLVDRLMEIVQHEPESDPRPAAERDTANDPGVRVAAAVSMGAIGVLKAAPALIEALSDADLGVRRNAHDALKRITGLDPGYDPEPFIMGSSDKTHLEVAKAQAAKRQEGIDRWKQWWQDTHGAGVLVTRFWNYQGQIKGGEPSKLYDREAYLRELRNRSYTQDDPAATIEQAQRTAERFHAGKDRILKDAVDLGPAAIDKFIAQLSGAVAGDERLSPDLQARSRAVTRFFVAESVARIIADAKAVEKVAVIREKVGAGTRDEKAGAALALGYLPKDMSGPEDRDALEKRGLEDAEPEVREAASRSLGRIGTPENGPALAKVAAMNSITRTGEAAQLAALRAIVALAPKHEEVVQTCGELVGDESNKRSSSSAVREAACDALGAIGDPAAIKNFWLFRGRRDIARGVREAATRAIAAIAAADPATPDAIAAVVSSGAARSIDRTGAALALGDLAEPRTIPALVWQMVDRNPPQALKASDAAVRAYCAEALGNMGGKARYRLVGEKLVEALEDPSDLVKSAAIEALRKIAPTSPDEEAFRVKDPASARSAGVARLKAWLESNRDKWPELPQ